MQKRIEGERFRLVQKKILFVFISSVLGGLGLIATFWTIKPRLSILVWFSCLLAFWLLGLFYSVYLNKQYTFQSPTAFEKKLYYIFPVVSGTIWGGAGWYFFDPNVPIHVFSLVLILFVVIAGAAMSMAYIRWAFPAFALTVITPLSLRLVLEDSAQYDWAAFLLISLIIIVIKVNDNVYHSIIDSIEIRFKNSDLIEKLRGQTEELANVRLQRELAIKANEDTSRFLAVASHDLRQPIHSLTLLTDALEPQVATKAGKSILGLIKNANDALYGLLSSLLDVSKLDAGIVEPKIERVELAPLLSNVTDNYRVIAKKAGLDFRVRLQDCYVDTDISLLSSAVMNLLDNAIKYTASGGVLLAMRVYKEQVKVQVFDTGIGIDKNYVNKIFQEFMQLANAERDVEKGLGLGLSISQRILELLGCNLSVSSILGQGSVFAITMPLSKQPVVDVPVAVSFGSEDCEIVREEGVTVLVVDDNPAVCEAMVLALKSWGYVALFAGSIEEVESIAQGPLATTIDVIAVDYFLGENITGIDALGRFEMVAERKVPAFLITGDTSADRTQEAIALGLPLLHKPLKQGECKMVLRRLIKGTS